MERERKKNNTIINILLCLLYLKIKHKSYVGKKILHNSLVGVLQLEKDGQHIISFIC